MQDNILGYFIHKYLYGLFLFSANFSNSKIALNTLSQIQCPKKALRKTTSVIKHNFSHTFCLKWDFTILKYKQHLLFLHSFATFNLTFQSHGRGHGFMPKNRDKKLIILVISITLTVILCAGPGKSVFALLFSHFSIK